MPTSLLPGRCPSCGVRDIPWLGSSRFWTIAILDAVVLAAAIVWYCALDPGLRPPRPSYRIGNGTFLETNEPVPENWKEFLPPGVEDLRKEREGGGVVKAVSSVEGSSG